MAGNSFAKVVVFSLIGVNLGAYYVFWPANHGARAPGESGDRSSGFSVCEPK